jgi:hypothetical protein
MEKAKIELIGRMCFQFSDYNETIYNESVDCGFDLYGVKGGEIMPLEEYYSFCKRFALLMDFDEKRVNDLFCVEV